MTYTKEVEANLTNPEIFACDTVLSEWNHNMDFKEIQSAIYDGDGTVCIWEPFENMPTDYVNDHLDDLVRGFKRHALEMCKDLFKAIEDGDQQAIADHMISLRAQLEA